MENKLKSYFIMYWYLRRTFSLKDRTKTSEKEKEKRGKNVRICSPSLALKKRGALERYCCWSSQVPICVPAPCDPSLWPLTPVIPVLNSDPQSCQSSAGAVGVSLRHTPGWWWPVTNLISQSHRGRSKTDTVAFLILLLLSRSLKYQNVEWLSEMQLILWLPKALQATICLSPNSNQTVTKPMPQP